MTLFLILVASIFAEKKLKQYANFIRSQLIEQIDVNTYKFFPTNPDLCLFQDIRPLKLDVNMNDILQFVLVLIFYEGQVFSEFSIQFMNGCSFDIHFNFPHNFKTTNIVNIGFKKLQILQFYPVRLQIYNVSEQVTLGRGVRLVTGISQNSSKFKFLFYPNGKYRFKCYMSQLFSHKYPYQLGN